MYTYICIHTYIYTYIYIHTYTLIKCVFGTSGFILLRAPTRGNVLCNTCNMQVPRKVFIYYNSQAFSMTNLFFLTVFH